MNAASDEGQGLETGQTKDTDDGRVPMADLPCSRFPFGAQERSIYTILTRLYWLTRFDFTGRNWAVPGSLR